MTSLRSGILFLVCVCAIIFTSSVVVSAASAASSNSHLHPHHHLRNSHSSSQSRHYQHHHHDHHHDVHSTTTTTSNQVSVKSYGAVGNGIINDAPAIQDALTALIASAQPNQPNILYFPEGEYLVTISSQYNVSGSGAFFNFPSQPQIEWSIVGVSELGTTIIWNPNVSLPLFSFNAQDNTVSNTGSKVILTQLTVTTTRPVQLPDPLPDCISMFQTFAIEEVMVADFTYQGQSAQDSVCVIQLTGSATVDTTSSVSITSSTGGNFSVFLVANDVTSTFINEVQLNGMSQGFSFASGALETQNIEIDRVAVLNYNTAINFYDNGLEGPQSTYNMNLTNSYFNCGPTSSWNVCGYTFFASTAGLVTVNNCTFVDEVQQNVAHLLPMAGTMIITNNTFRSGQVAFDPFAGLTSFTITDNIFTGTFYDIIRVDINAESMIIMNNVCQGPSTELRYDNSSCTTSPTSPCQTSNNQGCTVANHN